ncbi:MAG: adenylate/guanylate cyclase domain-containing protein [Bermanella sp.]
MTLKQQNWPFRYRLLFFSLVLSLLAILIVALPIAHTAVQQLEQQASQLRNTLSKQTSLQASAAIFSQDLLSLNVILATLVEHPHIAYAAVYSLDNEVIAEQGQAIKTPSKPMSIQYQDEIIALLEVRLDEHPLQTAILRIYGLLGILSLLFTILCSTGGWWLGTALGHKLRTSQRDIEQLGSDDRPTTLHSWGELSQLSSALQQHRQQQVAEQAMQVALSQFMTPNVNDNASLNYEQPELPDGYAHAAILFIDFVDLAAAQRQMPPQALAALLNQYYFFIHQAARLYNGSVDKYLGNGVMVLFGIPQQDDKDCFHGVCSALLLIGLLKQFNKTRQDQQQPTIEFQLGLHTGPVLAGTFGDRDSLAYATLGEAIHVAARLCRQGQANRLLLSKQVIDEGKLGGQLIISKHQSILGSQPEQSIDTFWVDNLTPNYQALIERQIQHISALPSNATS